MTDSSPKGRKFKVLVVDDDPSVRELVSLYLEKEGLMPVEASTGEEALHLISQHSPEVVILDIMLPETDGLEICRNLRRISDVPIIMLTAKGEEADRVVGLELGADDYVVKPFSPRELVARVKAVLRRGKEPVGRQDEVIRFPGLEVNRSNHRVLVNDEEVSLTPMEFRLLWYLGSHEGRVCSRKELLERVWGYDSDSDVRTVDVHVKRLRRKLAAPKAAFSIATVWGLGYRFECK
ncbi:MAG: response regulator [Armatimonadetes bacterium]|nr:response regulator [Armatimonadota bacterium]NIM22869.1 response regulator [Armatimonadota bacterium]NIM66735.1 response regulator [Armatimonadota bacterium]NIM75292.1 response regulator [Armatimonadota bacterium]NIN04932.1 response regulator [Armatimonadota bacterium]